MATFTLRNVPTIEACQFSDTTEFYEWAQDWGFDFEVVFDRDDVMNIRFRVKQTMSAEEWATAKPGDWIIHGVFDCYVMDDKSFRSYYKAIDK